VGIQPGLVHQAGVLPGRECCDGVRVHGVLPLAAVDRRLAANVGSRHFPRHRAGFKTALHRPQGGPPYHRRMQGLGFDDLRLFARVAALGSLSAAARERDVPVSQVSRALTRIERSCGVRLVHRSTHGLALSAEGETFLGYCQRVTAALDELEGDFASQAREPSGLVRVAASSVVAQYLLLPSLAGLATRSCTSTARWATASSTWRAKASTLRSAPPPRCPTRWWRVSSADSAARCTHHPRTRSGWACRSDRPTWRSTA
jgi:molybdenum-dependent DNA-binding transcriptional regulator ModE